MSENAPILLLRVTPGAASAGLAGIWESPEGERRLIVRVTAAPEKGKANKAVVALIAKALGVAKSSVSVISGETDRNKVLRIDAEGAGDAIARLMAEAAAR